MAHGSVQAAIVLDNDISSVSTATYNGSIYSDFGTKAFDNAVWQGGNNDVTAWRTDGTGAYYVQQNFPESYAVTRLAANAINAYGIVPGSGLRDFNVLAGDTEASLAVVATFQYQNADNTWQIFDLPGSQPAKVWRIQPFGGTWRSDNHIYVTEFEMESNAFPPDPSTNYVVTYRRILVTDDPAPGLPGVTHEPDFHGRGLPTIDHQGQVSVVSELSSGVDAQAVWTETNGVQNHHAMTGDPAPGTDAGITFDSFDRITRHTDGSLTFVANLAGPGTNNSNNQGFWTDKGGALSMIARSGDPAPGISANFINTGHPNVNPAGQIAFNAPLTGPGIDSANDYSIWSEAGGTLHLVAQEGDPAPGASGGAVFTYFRDRPRINASGQTVFYSEVAGGTRGIWMESGGILSKVVMEGDPVHSSGGGAVFTEGGGFPVMKNPGINDNGQVVFWSYISGTGVTSDNDSGIWMWDNGAYTQIARTGESAPGTVDDAVFDWFSNRYPIMNGAGDTVFRAGLRNTAGTGDTQTIWLERNGALELVARQGNHAPGTPAGTSFRFSQLGITTLLDPIINLQGQVAFLNSLTGPDVTTDNDLGLWATGPDGELYLVARQGDLFDVDPDPLVEDLRTINDIWIHRGSGGQDGQFKSFSDNGELAFKLQFTDQTEGIFTAMISNVSLIPGDLDGDGFVGINDLNIVLANWNQNVPPANPLADPSGDGFVGIDDLNTVLGNWNAGTPPMQHTIPEPSGVLLLGAGLLLRRRSMRV